MKVKVTGTSLERDTHSKALLETNLQKHADYVARRNIVQKKFADKDERIANLESQIEDLWAAINRLASGTLIGTL
jgi:hypothetical protein